MENTKHEYYVIEQHLSELLEGPRGAVELHAARYPLYIRTLFTSIVRLDAFGFGKKKDEEGKREVISLSKNAVGLLHKTANKVAPNLLEELKERYELLVEENVSNEDSELVEEFFQIFEEGYDDLYDADEAIHTDVMLSRITKLLPANYMFTTEDDIEPAVTETIEFIERMYKPQGIKLEIDGFKPPSATFTITYLGKTKEVKTNFIMHWIEYVNQNVPRNVEMTIKGENPTEEILEQFKELVDGDKVKATEVRHVGYNMYTVASAFGDLGFSSGITIVHVTIDPNAETVVPEPEPELPTEPEVPETEEYNVPESINVTLVEDQDRMEAIEEELAKFINSEFTVDVADGEDINESMVVVVVLVGDKEHSTIVEFK